MGFSFCHLGHAQGVGHWGAGVPRGSKKVFFKHGHVAYQIEMFTSVWWYLSILPVLHRPDMVDIGVYTI